MSKSVLVAVLVTMLCVGAAQAWPRVPLPHAGFTKRNIQKKQLAEYDGPAPVGASLDAGESGEMTAKAWIDVMAVAEAWKAVKNDEPVPWGGADFLPFLGDVIILGGEMYVGYKLGEETYQFFKSLGDEDDEPAPQKNSSGTIDLDGAIVDGDTSLDTVGNDVSARGAHFKGDLDINTAAAAAEVEKK